MSPKYSPKYTPCGRSIITLKANARFLKKSNSEISQRKALDQVAQSYSYFSWDEMVNQISQKRDGFFDHCYRSINEDQFTKKYQEYLDLNHLKDTADSYRIFVLDLYAKRSRGENDKQAPSEAEIKDNVGTTKNSRYPV